MNEKVTPTVSDLQTVTEPAQDQFLSIIENAVSRDGMNPEIIDRLLDAKHKHDAEQARRAFYRAMSMFRQKAPTIQKNRTPDERAKIGRYAGLPETLEAVQPLEASLGLAHRWETASDAERITVTCIVSHEQGHSEQTTLSAPADTSGAKNAVQAIGSTVSYLERYTFMAAFGLASADMDDDGYAAGARGAITDDQLAQIIEKMDEVDDTLDRDVFETWLRDVAGATGENMFDLLKSIPRSKFRTVICALEKKAKKGATA